jgi:hypothetical protein
VRRLAVVIAATIALGLPARASSQFSDVPDGHPLQKPIEVLAGQEIMPGITPTMFGGTNFLNRYTMADILHALIGSEYVPFRVVVYSDVPSGHPSLPAINRITTLNLMTIDKGAFKGKDLITRYEMASLIDKLLQFRSAQAPTRRPNPIAFKDVPANSPHSLAVERVVNAWQLTDGFPDGTFQGNKPITRFEAVEFVAKAGALLDPRVREAMAFNQATTPSAAPTAEPMATPTAVPTIAGTPTPPPMPTATPYQWPSQAMPTRAPTPAPTAMPTARPTAPPTTRPTAQPTARPTARPTSAPTAAPTPAWTPDPTPMPSAGPSVMVHLPGDQVPWYMPTPAPSAAPSAAPTAATATPAPNGSGGIAFGSNRSPFEGWVAAFGGFGAIGENIAMNLTQQPGQPVAQPTPFPNQPTDEATGQGGTTPAFGIMGQYWYGAFGGTWDIESQKTYIVVNNQGQGIGTLMEAVNARFQLLYKLPIRPGMEVAAGLEGSIRSTDYVAGQQVTVSTGYFQAPRTYSGGGLAGRFGYRILDNLALDAGLSVNYLLMQAGTFGSWDRIGANIHALGRYDIWRTPVGPLVAIGGYQGHVGQTMAGDGLETVHMLRLGIGLTFAPAP